MTVRAVNNYHLVIAAPVDDVELEALVRAVADEAAHRCRAAPSRPVERSGVLGHDHPRLGQRS